MKDKDNKKDEKRVPDAEPQSGGGNNPPPPPPPGEDDPQ